MYKTRGDSLAKAPTVTGSKRDKAQTVSVLNGFKNDQSYKLTGEEIVKITKSKLRKNKLKFEKFFITI